MRALPPKLTPRTTYLKECTNSHNAPAPSMVEATDTEDTAGDPIEAIEVDTKTEVEEEIIRK